MKPFKTLGSAVFSLSALFLVSSCTKSAGDQQSKDDRETAMLVPTCNACGPYINLQTKQGGNNFFWVGDRDVLANRQNFSGTNFTENKYFDVTATGGSPFVSATGNIGVMGGGETAVDQEYINVGEQLTLKLSSCMTGFKMTAVELILHGNEDVDGTMEVWDGATKIADVPISNPGGIARTQNFQFSYNIGGVVDKFFDKLVFKSNTSRFLIQGFQLNNNPSRLRPGKFYIANTKGAAYMRNAGGSDAGITRTYINQGQFSISEGPTANRQYKQQGEGNGKGNYTFTNPGKWLNITSNAPGGLLFYRANGFRLAVNDEYLDLGEVMTITPGTSFPSSKFDAFECRVATQNLPGDILKVTLWDGLTNVGGGFTSNADQSYKIFYGSRPFTRVTIEGTTASGPANRASIGRASQRVMTLYPSCLP